MTYYVDYTFHCIGIPLTIVVVNDHQWHLTRALSATLQHGIWPALGPKLAWTISMDHSWLVVICPPPRPEK